VTEKRKLIEVALPLEAINRESAREKAEVTITVEIEATAESGFDDDIRRTVSENARTLKFETHEFED